jgi:hypothetical protein
MSALCPEGFIGHELEADRHLYRGSSPGAVNAVGHFMMGRSQARSVSHPGFRGPKPGREHNHQVCWDQVSHI